MLKSQKSQSAPTQVFEECDVQTTPTPTPRPEMKIWAGLATLDMSWSRVPPPRNMMGTGVWRLTSISPTDTVSFPLQRTVPYGRVVDPTTFQT